MAAVARDLQTVLRMIEARTLSGENLAQSMNDVVRDSPPSQIITTLAMSKLPLRELRELAGLNARAKVILESALERQWFSGINYNIARLERENSEADAKLAKMRGALAEIDTKIERLKGSNASSQDDVAQLQQEIHRLQSVRAEEARAIAALEEEVQQMRDRLDRMQGQVNRLADLNAECETLRARYESMYFVRLYKFLWG